MAVSERLNGGFNFEGHGAIGVNSRIWASQITRLVLIKTFQMPF
jgi:hypothetical protein